MPDTPPTPSKADAPPWLLVVTALLVGAIAFGVGYQQGRYDGAWGTEAKEHRVANMDHAYSMGGLNQRIGTYDREAFVAKLRLDFGLPSPILMEWTCPKCCDNHVTIRWCEKCGYNKPLEETPDAP
jgi:hypothetical protein